MPTRGHLTQVAAILAAVLITSSASALLAGCDGHSKPTVAGPLPSMATTPVADSPSSSAPGASVSSSLSGEPTAAPSSLDPSAAASKYPDAAAKIPAAIQTVRNYFTAFNHEIDTGDENEVTKLFTPDCTKCISDVSSVRDLLDGGHKLRGGHVILASVDHARATGPHAVAVEVTGTQAEGDQTDASGDVIHHFPASPPMKLEFEVDTSPSMPAIYKINLVGE